MAPDPVNTQVRRDLQGPLERAAFDAGAIEDLSKSGRAMQISV